MVETVAAGLGHLIRLLLILLRMLPGIIGPITAITGVWMLNHPAAYILAGLVLWAADLRIGSIRPGRKETE